MLHLAYLWAICRRMGASIILRNEDHDRQRSKDLYLAAIFEDLKWLGFIPDPEVGLMSPQFIDQSADSKPYEAAIFELSQRSLVYACDCSRPQIQARNPQYRGLYYDGFCRQRGLPFESGRTSLRLKFLNGSREAFLDLWRGGLEAAPDLQGDLALIDKKGNYSYFLTNVVDDLHQGIDLIIRGEDILPFTAAQVYLRKILVPKQITPTYAHHRLLFEPGSTTEKRSKRQKSESIAALRERGESSLSVLRLAMQESGISAQFDSLKELLDLS